MFLEEYIVGLKKANITEYEEFQQFDLYENLKSLYHSK